MLQLYDLTDIAPVVLVHHPGPDVDVVFPGEAGPRSHAAVGAARDADLKVSLHQTLASCWDGGILNYEYSREQTLEHFTSAL